MLASCSPYLAEQHNTVIDKEQKRWHTLDDRCLHFSLAFQAIGHLSFLEPAKERLNLKRSRERLFGWDCLHFAIPDLGKSLCKVLSQRLVSTL